MKLTESPNIHMKPVPFIFLFILSFAANAQKIENNCRSLRNGSFYYYSQKNLSYSSFTRNDSVQVEIDRLKNDTTTWRITWKGCDYHLKFLRSTKKNYVWHEKKFTVHIIKLTDEYYIYQTSAVNKKSPPVSDTLWLRDVPSKFLDRKITDARFPGGDTAWQTYLSRAIEVRMNKVSPATKGGICYIEFTINRDGTLSDVKTLSMEHSEVVNIAIQAFKRSPRWKPATIDGVTVSLTKVQPVTLQVEKEEINPPEY